MRIASLLLSLAIAGSAGATALSDWTPYFLVKYTFESGTINPSPNTGYCGTTCDVACGSGGTHDGTNFVQGAFSLGLASATPQTCATYSFQASVQPPPNSGFDAPVTWGCWIRPTLNDADMTLIDGSVGSAHGWKLDRQMANHNYRCYFGSGSGTVGPPIIQLSAANNSAPLNTFAHVVCRSDAIAQRADIFVNGASQANSTPALTAAARKPGWFMSLGPGFGDAYVDAAYDECFVYNGALRNVDVCRVCSCGIDGARCTRTGTAFTVVGDNATRCGSCTLPDDASLDRPTNGLGTSTTSTSTSSTTSSTSAGSTTSTTIAAGPALNWTSQMIAVWHLNAASNATQTNDGTTSCGATCNLTQNGVGTTQDTTNKVENDAAAANFNGFHGGCTSDTRSAFDCTSDDTTASTGCLGATCPSCCSSIVVYLEKASPASQLNITSDLSAGCWIRPVGTAWESGGAGGELNNRIYALNHYDPANRVGYQLGIRGNHSIFVKVDDSEVLAPAPLASNGFHHIGFTWLNSQKRASIYVDGANKYALGALSLSSATAPFRIGRNMNIDKSTDPYFVDLQHEFYDSFKGQIDECYVYSGTVSDPGMCRICSCQIDGSNCTCGIDGVSYTSTGRNVASCGSCTLPVCNANSPLVTTLVAATTTTTSTSSSTSSSIAVTTSTSVTSSTVTTTTSTSVATSSTVSTSTSTSTSSTLPAVVLPGNGGKIHESGVHTFPGTLRAGGSFVGNTELLPTPFGSLGSVNNGTVKYCSDCVANTNPCQVGGSGTFAFRRNGAWVCL